MQIQVRAISIAANRRDQCATQMHRRGCRSDRSYWSGTSCVAECRPFGAQFLQRSWFAAAPVDLMEPPFWTGPASDVPWTVDENPLQPGMWVDEAPTSYGTATTPGPKVEECSA